MTAPQPPAYQIRAWTPADFAAVARIHCAAFRGRGLSVLGESIVAEYYRWQLEHVPAARPLVACSAGKVVGFVICGDSLRSTAEFMRTHVGAVMGAMLRRPWILADRRLIRFAIYALRLLLPRLNRGGGGEPSSVSSGRRFWVEVAGVDPAEQGRGLGTQLLAACEEIAAAQNYSECFLAVDPGNADAIRLYLRLNWERVSQNGVWRGRMRKSLLNVNADKRSNTYSAC
jgi:ribosomal protein S18 acetylase RimI-like enzyme